MWNLDSTEGSARLYTKIGSIVSLMVFMIYICVYIMWIYRIYIYVWKEMELYLLEVVKE